MPRISKYVVQPAPKSLCPKCNSSDDVMMLCHHAMKDSKPFFFICFRCRHIAQGGVGPVKREFEEPEDLSHEGSLKHLSKITTGAVNNWMKRKLIVTEDNGR